MQQAQTRARMAAEHQALGLGARANLAALLCVVVADVDGVRLVDLRSCPILVRVRAPSGRVQGEGEGLGGSVPCQGMVPSTQTASRIRVGI